MRMEQYLTNIDYSLWQVILNGDGPIQVTTKENGVETKVPPKTAQALLQRQRERKAKIIFLLAIPNEYQPRFHGIKDAKSLWAAIKSRFGGNVESKKMQKNVLKQQFENFSVSDIECLDKAYDRPDYENKDSIENLDIDDLYNNLKVFEADIKGSSGSSSNSQNVSFLLQKTLAAVMKLILLMSNSPQLDDEDLEQIDHDDLEKMDLKWLNALTVIEGAILQGMYSTKKSKEQDRDVGYEQKHQKDWSDTEIKLDTGYGDQLNENDSSGSELFNSVFDSRLDDSVYRPTSNKTSASMPSGVIIEDWVSDDEDIFQSNDLQATDKADLSFAGLDDSVYRPTANKTSYLKCYYSHLIKDCDFHEKRMAKKSVLKNMGKNTGQREFRPVWNSDQRINHQNKFVQSRSLDKVGDYQLCLTKQALKSNNSTLVHLDQLLLLPIQIESPNTRISNEKVNTVRVNGVNIVGQTAVSVVKGNGVLLRPQQGNPQQALKNKGIFNIRCSRHITGNKDFLTDYKTLMEVIGV
ncbi:hypothetical protein Tco_0585990 [Tanacetum coccineum]